VRILGADPGGTTGIVILDTDSWSVLASGHPTAKDAYAALEHAMGFWSVDRVGIEAFTITARTAELSRQYDALYLIGWTTGLCLKHRIPLVVDTAGNAKAVWSDARLKAHPAIDDAVRNEHARDALRHALLTAQKAGETPPR
jgi:hypothetical protein